MAITLQTMQKMKRISVFIFIPSAMWLLFTGIAFGATFEIDVSDDIYLMRDWNWPNNPTFGFLRVDHEIWILVALAVVFIGFSKFALDYMERLAKREGRLTERRR